MRRYLIPLAVLAVLLLIAGVRVLLTSKAAAPAMQVALPDTQRLLRLLPDGQHAAVRDTMSGALIVYDLSAQTAVLTTSAELGAVRAVFPLAGGLLAEFAPANAPLAHLRWWDLATLAASPLELPLPQGVWGLRTVLDQGDATTALLDATSILDRQPPVYRWNWRSGALEPTALLGADGLLQQAEPFTLRVWASQLELLDRDLAVAHALPLASAQAPALLAANALGTTAALTLQPPTPAAPLLANVYSLEPLTQTQQLNVALDSVAALSVSPNGLLVALAGTPLADGQPQIVVYDTARGALAARFPGHASATTALQFTPDSTGLWSAGDDSTLRFWVVE